ncbi:MAG TPA: zinc-ribbon and DUF3426 domain-containing protein [Gammaproteobacteria bacterium]|nr:zinc-ribbon and DUF3426 domain-containing protein [Gammaproteobacteria bacterium]
MLSLCPHCKTVFRVHAKDLASARGFVECGACDRVFNALDYLVDELARAPVPPAAMPEIPPPALPVAKGPASAARDEEGPRVGVANLDDVVIAESEPPMPRIALVEPDTSPVLGVDVELDEAPSVLREDLARLAAEERNRGRFAWSLLALLLMLGLAAQAAWHWRSDLLERFPQLRPHAMALCARLGCRLEEPVGVADIELVARDVRDHPQYAQTLLVNATLQNRGKHAAKFPVIQLGVYDSSGVAVGVRRFAPSEYLDRSIDIDAGMPAGSRVYIVLEIAGVGDRADSFEFLFL